MKLPQGTDNPQIRNLVKEVRQRPRHGIGENAILNGTGVIVQRPTTGGVFDSTYNTDPFYVNDHWKCYSDGNDIIDVSWDSSTQAIKLAQVTAKRWAIAQAVDSYETAFYSGQTASACFEIKADTATNVRFALLSHTGSAQSVASDIVSSWGATPTWAANLTAENTIEDLSVTTSFRKIEIPNISVDTSGVNNLVFVVWTSSEEDVGQNIYIRNCKLERNKICTPYNYFRFGDDLRSCQRYYCTIGSSSTGHIVGTGWSTSTTNARVAVWLPVQMRINTPTVTSTPSDWSLGITTPATAIGINSNASDGRNIGLQITTGATLSAFTFYEMQRAAGTSSIEFDAEIF
jgi:hypothetical protein